MPTYDYVCEACGATFEREQRITEDPINTCIKCGANKAKRMITQGNFILKGSGWYSDLYSGPSNNKSDSKKESKSGSTTSNAPSTKSSSESSKKATESSKPAKKAAGAGNN